MAKWLDQKKDELSLKDKKLLELGSGTCSAGSLDFHFPLEPVFRLPGFVLAFFARRSLKQGPHGVHCQVDLTDRYEVLEDLDAAWLISPRFSPRGRGEHPFRLSEY